MSNKNTQAILVVTLAILTFFLVSSFDVNIAYAADADFDGIDDSTDNCPAIPNPTQTDQDNDGIGDVCDSDVTTITLAPVAEGTKYEGRISYGSSSGVWGCEDVHFATLIRGGIHVSYLASEDQCVRNTSNGIIEFDISSLSSLVPGTFSAELMLYGTSSSGSVIVNNLGEAHERLPLSSSVYGDAYIGSLSVVPIVSSPKLHYIDVTTTVNNDLLQLSSNSYSGFFFSPQTYSGFTPYGCCYGWGTNANFYTSSSGPATAPALRIIVNNNNPTAITLSSFTAKLKEKNVELKWQTATEIDNLGFNILRSESESGEYVKINKKLIRTKGSSTKGASYKFKDKNVTSGKTYWYKLEDIDSENAKTMNGPKSVAVSFRKKK